MKIAVGSKNPVKVEAVKEMVEDYPCLNGAEVFSREVSSNVSDQPKSLEETVRGAMSRAEGAFLNCDYAFGIESGLVAVPKTRTGVMDVCICAIYDGKEFYLGMSSAWELPKKVADLMLKEGLNMNNAAFRAGLTENSEIGSAEGLIGIVTNGRLTRKGYTKEAIRTALIHLENK